MSDLTPVTVEKELRRLCHLLEERTQDLADAARRAAETEVAHKHAAAEAMVKMIRRDDKMTVGEREARVLLETADLYQARKLAEATRDAAQEGCRSLRTQIAAVQSVNANLRELAK